jgi:hypothetical protein
VPEHRFSCLRHRINQVHLKTEVTPQSGGRQRMSVLDLPRNAANESHVLRYTGKPHLHHFGSWDKCSLFTVTPARKGWWCPAICPKSKPNWRLPPTFRKNSNQKKIVHNAVKSSIKFRCQRAGQLPRASNCAVKALVDENASGFLHANHRPSHVEI